MRCGEKGLPYGAGYTKNELLPRGERKMVWVMSGRRRRRHGLFINMGLRKRLSLRHGNGNALTRYTGWRLRWWGLPRNCLVAAGTSNRFTGRISRPIDE